MTMTLTEAAEVIATRVGGMLTSGGTHHAMQLIMHNRGFAGEAVARAEQNGPIADRGLIAEARHALEAFHIGLPS